MEEVESAGPPTEFLFNSWWTTRSVDEGLEIHLYEHHVRHWTGHGLDFNRQHSLKMRNNNEPVSINDDQSHEGKSKAKSRNAV